MAITHGAARKILKEAGAFRVSDIAVVEFTDIVNKFAYSMAKKSVRLAEHAKRKTVQKIDIELSK